MKEILYLDVYFLINGVMDLVSLMLAGLIASERGRGWRLVTAALFGSGASLVLLVISPPPFLTLLFGFLTFPVMILIAYGLRSVKRLFFISLFAFLSALFLGAPPRELLGPPGHLAPGHVRTVKVGGNGL